MNKKVITIITTFLLCAALCIAFISCAGGGSAGDSSAEGLAINIKTQKNDGRAASKVAYTFTLTLSGKSYFRTATKTGNPVKFYFDDVPTEENIDASVTVKLGSVLMFSGNKVINIDEGENKITIDLSNQLEDTIEVPYSEVGNIKTILSKSMAETPTIILTGSNADMSDVIFQIKESGKKANLNLLNTTKTSFSMTEVAIFNTNQDYFDSIQLPEGSILELPSDVLSSKISCSKPTIKFPSSSNYANTVLTIQNNSKLTNVILDYNNKFTQVSAIGTHPTRVTGVKLTGVQKISDDAFKGWTGLKNSTITIPASVTQICQHAFAVGGGDSTGNLRLNFEVTSGWQKDTGSGWQSYSMPSSLSASSIVFYGFKRS